MKLKDITKLKESAKIAEIRDEICLIFSKYCSREGASEDPCRFAKLLMRLPPIRSWSLKANETLFTIKTRNNFDNILVDMIVND